jgi:hypothetical protein
MRKVFRRFPLAKVGEVPYFPRPFLRRFATNEDPEGIPMRRVFKHRPT